MPLTKVGKLAAVCAALALGAVGAAPVSAGAAPPSGLDTVNVTGHAYAYFSFVDITAQSGPSGENPTGTVSYIRDPDTDVDGPVTCLRVTGPGLGAGTPAAPTTATLNFRDSFTGRIFTVELVDNGGGGADQIRDSDSFRSATDCSPLLNGVSDGLFSGRAIVFDAPSLPTSKAQCRKGGYAQFGFKNQGQCVAFVNHR